MFPYYLLPNRVIEHPESIRAKEATTWVSIYLSLCLSVCLYVCLSVFLSSSPEWDRYHRLTIEGKQTNKLATM